MSLSSRWMSLLAAVVCTGVAPVPAAALPIFARQTNKMCAACHTQLLELNPMGRSFKLNGYRLSKIDSLLGTIEDNSPSGRSNLLLNLVSSVGVMAQASYSTTKKAQPGTMNGTVELPQQLSLFVGGRMSPKMGAFAQLTYDPEAGSVGMDNLDIRYADSVTLFSKTTIVGFSLNNNPSVQDLWNTTPAWRFPWVSSPVAPTPAASALIDGSLAQQVAGLSALAMWNNRIYGEVGVYRSAPLGVKALADSTSQNTVSGVAPYWRVAFTQNWPMNSLMLGAYGMNARIIPEGVEGPANRFTDVGFDFQDQIMLGANHLSLHGTWIHEKQQFDGGGAANPTNTLNTYRGDAILHLGQRFALGAGPFATSGTSDDELYAPSPLGGSVTSSPNSSGLLGEFDINLWENVRMTMQYVAYNKFNGASQNYDGFGRNASDNNTLYVMTWLVF